MKINTVNAFKSISVSHSAMQRLAQHPKSRELIESFGIDPHNFVPVVVTEIDVEQWIKLLQFYAKKCRYNPAKEILASLKGIIKA
jgi:hypothetical protein